MLKEWETSGYLALQKAKPRTWLHLTEEGLGLSDYLGPQLISDEVRHAMEEWEKENGCEPPNNHLQR